jgi:hypothetical protein
MIVSEYSWQMPGIFFFEDRGSGITAKYRRCGLIRGLIDRFCELD